MEVIYFVFECDKHRDYATYSIKYCSTNYESAKAVYKKLKPKYKNDDKNYYLNLGEYESDESIAFSTSNILREIYISKTTEKNQY